MKEKTMGRQVRIDDALRPAVLMLREAYECRKITADEVNAMVCYLLHGTADDDAAAEDEGVSEGVSLTVSLPVSLKEENERKERSKENKEKEERVTTTPTTKKILKKRKNFQDSMALPTFEEVNEYHEQKGYTTFTAKRFFSYYNNFNWKVKGGSELVDWRGMMDSWEENELNKKHRNNVTNTNQQRQAAGAGAQAGQAGQAGQAEEHRRENMEKHLASHHPGDDRLAGLARQINEVAQEVGVSTAEYSLQQIAYDAQSLLYKFVWCQGWTDERWREVMQQVARCLKKAAQPGEKAKLDSNALFEMVFGLTTKREERKEKREERRERIRNCSKRTA